MCYWINQHLMNMTYPSLLCITLQSHTYILVSPEVVTIYLPPREERRENTYCLSNYIQLCQTVHS